MVGRDFGIKLDGDAAAGRQVEIQDIVGIGLVGRRHQRGGHHGCVGGVAVALFEGILFGIARGLAGFLVLRLRSFLLGFGCLASRLFGSLGLLVLFLLRLLLGLFGLFLLLLADLGGFLLGLARGAGSGPVGLDLRLVGRAVSCAWTAIGASSIGMNDRAASDFKILGI